MIYRSIAIHYISFCPFPDRWRLSYLPPHTECISSTSSFSLLKAKKRPVMRYCAANWSLIWLLSLSEGHTANDGPFLPFRLLLEYSAVRSLTVQFLLLSDWDKKGDGSLSNYRVCQGSLGRDQKKREGVDKVVRRTLRKHQLISNVGRRKVGNTLDTLEIPGIWNGDFIWLKH